MEVGSSTEMGAPGASHLGNVDHGPKTDRSRPRSAPVNALVLTGVAKFGLVGCANRTLMTVDLRSVAYAASRISSTLKGSTKQFGWLQAFVTSISSPSATC